MTRFVLLTAALTALYLLVLASVRPGDVLVGTALAAAIAAASARAAPAGGAGRPLAGRAAGVPALALGTAADVVRGTWHVARYVLGRRRLGTPGLVAVPAGERTPSGIAAWGWLTSLSPDEVVVDVDEAHGTMLVHVLDASDPGAVRARHRETYERRQRAVFP